jgi:hypothetical protein
MSTRETPDIPENPVFEEFRGILVWLATGNGVGLTVGLSTAITLSVELDTKFSIAPSVFFAASLV